MIGPFYKQPNIENIDERIDPQNVPRGILSIHLKRYEFARAYCKNSNLLDAACGAGYGSFYLSKEADKVTGIDIDAETIAYAKRHYKSLNLEFKAVDILKTGFDTGSFDVICSFETIEHLRDITAYLNEITRLLRINGIYIVSTPKAAKTNNSPHNPYHTIEFSKKDFESLLGLFFEEVDMYGQRRRESELHYWVTRFLDLIKLRGRIPYFKRLRYSINRCLNTTAFEDMDLEDIFITKEKIKRATELIAICRKPRNLEQS